jgi:hypothetical protein
LGGVMMVENEKLKELKTFRVVKKEDLILLLQDLIITTEKNIRKYKRYIKELEDNLKEYGIHEMGSAGKTKFPNKIYDDCLSKISFIDNNLLNAIADDTKLAMSYLGFRKIAKKRIENKAIELELLYLTDEEEKIIKDFTKQRNWAHHLPFSLLTSKLRLIEQNPSLHKHHNLNPITINEFQDCEGSYPLNLYHYSLQNYENFRKIYQHMKKQYSRLIGQSIYIETRNITEPRKFEEIQATQLSTKVQAIQDKYIRPEHENRLK